MIIPAKRHIHLLLLVLMLPAVVGAPVLAEELQEPQKGDLPAIEEVPELLPALRRPGSNEAFRARHELRYNRQRWSPELLEFIDSGKGAPADQAAAVRCLASYEAPDLVPFYRGRLHSVLRRSREDKHAIAEVRVLLEALAFTGKAAEVELLKQGVNWLLTVPGKLDHVLITDQNYWPITVACIFLAERGSKEALPVIESLSRTLKANIQQAVARDPRLRNMASHHHAAVLFSVEYATRRLSGKRPLEAVMEILDVSKEYRVRVAAMNLVRELIDEEKTGIKRDQLRFPSRSDWEAEEMMKAYRHTLQNIGTGYGKIPAAAVTLSNGRYPVGKLDGKVLEMELQAKRRQLDAERGEWVALKDPLVGVDRPDILMVLQKRLRGLSLVWDQRLETPLVSDSVLR